MCHARKQIDSKNYVHSHKGSRELCEEVTLKVRSNGKQELSIERFVERIF